MRLHALELQAIAIMARGFAKEDCEPCFDPKPGYPVGPPHLAEDRIYYEERGRVAMESLKAAGFGLFF